MAGVVDMQKYEATTYKPASYAAPSYTTQASYYYAPGMLGNYAVDKFELRFY